MEALTKFKENQIKFLPEYDLDIKRFGHTVTLVNSNQAVIFGGAISISELYNDTHIYNIKEKKWTKLNPSGHVPGARAAHAACSPDTDIKIVFGGCKKNGGFSSNETYKLDLSQGDAKAMWSIINCKDPKPQRRYGHTMIYNKPNVFLFGGITKDRNKLLNDMWVLDMDNALKSINLNDNSEALVYEWKMIEFEREKVQPPPRMYHTCCMCYGGKVMGMIIIFGGRDEAQNPLNDLWGLRRHRNGSWEWVLAPEIGSTPLRRYQHTVISFDRYIVVLGGRGELNDDFFPNGMPMEIFNAHDLTWNVSTNFDKFRHVSFLLDKYAFVHGGCSYSDPQVPSNKIEMFDVHDLCYNQKKNKILNSKRTILTGSVVYSNNNLLKVNNDYKPIVLNRVEISTIKDTLKESYSYIGSLSNISFLNTSFKKISLDEDNKFETIINEEDDFFELYENFINTLLKPSDWKIPKKDEESGMTKFRFRREHIIALTRACQEIVACQPMVLRITTPVKIFGDIHGQFDDLMRFFEYWGEPSDKPGFGDIQSIDYLFLGDYVDRGTKSLETICLLMALKIKYPEKIHLLRGNHEDYLINSVFGFSVECEVRLADETNDDELNVFKIINEFFEYLPLAAVIDDQILCLHGGIGGSLQYIKEIEEIDRPLKIVHSASTPLDQIVMDILWSDPTDTDEELGIKPNLVRDTNSFGNIVKYGPDIVQKFLKNNNLTMIIRAHECVLDGIERFNGGKLITLFSATDYCRKHKNAGAMLVVNNNFEIIPHLIYPVSSESVKWILTEEILKKRPPTPLRKRSTINSENNQ